MNFLIDVLTSLFLGILYGHSFAQQQKSALFSSSIYKLLLFQAVKLIALPFVCYYLLLLPPLTSIILVGCFFATFWFVIIINNFFYEKP